MKEKDKDKVLEFKFEKLKPPSNNKPISFKEFLETQKIKTDIFTLECI